MVSCEDVRFQKYEGLGNDFVVVDAASADTLDSARAVALCDRHFGIGADGVLLVIPEPGPARARMLVLNADGSRPEMCGNGLRCVALHLARAAEEREVSFVVATDAGPRRCDVSRDGERATVRISLGQAKLTGSTRFEHAGRALDFAGVSMGNPHAVAFAEGVDARALDELGPALSARFAEGSNVEIAELLGPARLRLTVWERGVGRTLACGTGAGATVVAAARAGHVPYDAPVEVLLPGGTLLIEVRASDLEVSLTGPARRVFAGEAS